MPAVDSVCCFTTIQLHRCLLSEGLDAVPSACRMISLLTTADSKASLRQQIVYLCHGATKISVSLCELHFKYADFFFLPSLF